MGIELTSACSTCKEVFRFGTDKPHRWLGFQFGNRQVFSWFARHSNSTCKVFIGNDLTGSYPWEIDLPEEETERFMYVQYSLNTHYWENVCTVQYDLEHVTDSEAIDYFPNLRRGNKDSEVEQPTTKDHKFVSTLAFSFDKSLLLRIDNEYHIEILKNPLIVDFKNLTVEEVTTEWSEWVSLISSQDSYAPVITVKAY